jgi:hypothetical protein
VFSGFEGAITFIRFTCQWREAFTAQRGYLNINALGHSALSQNRLENRLFLANVTIPVPVGNQIRTYWARRTDVTGFGVPEHGDRFGLASARPKRQSQPRYLVIGWMSD